MIAATLGNLWSHCVKRFCEETRNVGIDILVQRDAINAVMINA